MKKITLLFIVASFLLFGCGANETSGATDPSAKIEAEVGKEFPIVLEANPTTGYHWEIVGDPQLELISRDYQSEADLPGSGGLETFTFKATNPGDALIVFGYFPPSNTPVEPAQTLTFSVSVK